MHRPRARRPVRPAARGGADCGPRVEGRRGIPLVGRVARRLRSMAMDATRTGADELPQGDEKVTAVRSMFDAIAPRYDLVNRIMTFRMDVGWRRRTVRDLHLAPRSLVADLACGTGDLCRELRAQGLRPVGFDLSYGMLANARTDAALAQA